MSYEYQYDSAGINRYIDNISIQKDSIQEVKFWIEVHFFGRTREVVRRQGARDRMSGKWTGHLEQVLIANWIWNNTNVCLLTAI